MAQGLSSMPTESEEKKTNKIHIGEIVQIQRQDNGTNYLDATLELIRLRGCDYGLGLAEYVKT